VKNGLYFLLEPHRQIHRLNILGQTANQNPVYARFSHLAHGLLSVKLSSSALAAPAASVSGNFNHHNPVFSQTE
jgi:hypothetical protein